MFQYRRALFLLPIIAAGLGAGWAVATGRVALPPEWNPWAPLTAAEPVGPLTRYKLTRLQDQPAACHAWLAESHVRGAPVPDRHTPDGCGWQDAYRVEALPGVRFSQPFTLACPAAVALALWEREGLQPAAVQHLGSRVVAVDHLGSYACRNVYGRAEGRRSEHAAANALDVAGFRLADGRRITVVRDWGPPDTQDGALPPVARFLRDAQRGACPFFNGVLGPAYNAAHQDHLHLDRGPYRICR